nr:tail fiber domain-containing protein [Nitratireductor sp.]
RDGMRSILECADSTNEQRADPSQCKAGGDEEKPTPSDVRLKTDIEKVGSTVLDLPLYRFRYRDGAQRYEGVMAQDVLKVAPDAVVCGEDGYYRVDYHKLGIRMRGV